ncbi:ornithine carbamoyltransferase [Ensifer sp. B1-9]|uniref:ornithine carbamoyltransferase n=1 Tax=Ensifer sp. B1-9 TaxID=3141455 RepID=UPI003D1C1825
MVVDLRGRSVLTLDELTSDEIRYLLQLVPDLKELKRAGAEVKRLSAKNIALLFERESIHTHAAFEVAAYDQGANVTLIGPTTGHGRYRESVKDAARFLGRLYDAIGYVGHSQATAEEFAKWSCVPVYNGMTDESHPTQALADLATMQQCSDKPLDDMIVAFLGDGRSNVARSLAVAASKLGIDLRIVSPQSFWPEIPFVERVTSMARDNGGQITVLEHVGTGVLGADFICTAPWFVEGDVRWAERVRHLAPFAIRENVMEATDNPRTKLMHSLPAWHWREDEVGARIARRFGVECMEVCDAVFESKSSIVFDQAENRMPAIKALLVATLVG